MQALVRHWRFTVLKSARKRLTFFLTHYEVIITRCKMSSQRNTFMKGNKTVFTLGTANEPLFPSCELPEIIILEIFKYFSIKEKLILRNVCKRWKELLHDFSIWKEIRVNEEITLVTSLLFKLLVEDFAITIQSINFSYVEWVRDNDVIFLARRCKNLRQLSIKSCQNITDIAIKEVAKNCVKLQNLDIFLTNVTSAGFDQVTIFCTKLQAVKLGSRGNTSRMISSICKNTSNIKQISIQDEICSSYNPAVDDTLIKRFAVKFNQVRRLCLSWCCHITNTSLEDIAEYCNSLTTLKLRECQYISAEGIISVLRGCTHLQNLKLEKLFRVNDELGEQYHFNLKKIISLKIIDTSITDNGIILLAKKLQEVRKLSLGNNTSRPRKIFGSCLKAVAEHCLKLNRLEVLCDCVNDECIVALGNCLKDLSFLSIGDCQQISGASLVHMATECRKIQFLRVENCEDIDDEQVRAMRRTLPYLKTFQLPGNTRVTSLDSWDVNESLY